MGKPGRPSKNGAQPMWMFRREIVVMYAYAQSRQRGEKRMNALRDAVEYVRKEYPRMPISERAVKRILAKWWPRGQHYVYLVSKLGPPDNVLKLPKQDDARKRYTVSIGLRP